MCTKSEQSRDFAKVGRYSVGLSSGTSGRRGLFVVSPEEQNVWSGSMLAKMLPKSLFSGERVALFLRANNNLYESVNNRWISLRFYDLLQILTCNSLHLNNINHQLLLRQPAMRDS